MSEQLQRYPITPLPSKNNPHILIERSVVDAWPQLSWGAIGLWVYLRSLRGLLDNTIDIDALANSRKHTSHSDIVIWVAELSQVGYVIPKDR